MQSLARYCFLSAVLAVSTFPGKPVQSQTGTIQDVKHVVILMQENRSFDQYYGCLAGVRGYADRNMLLFQNGRTVLYQHQGTNYVLPFHSDTECLTDVNHGWSDGHLAWNCGKWDEWIGNKGTSSMAYFTRTDIPFDYALAEAYTICDANFCSIMGPTFPNRLYEFTGMVDPNGTGGGPVTNNVVPPNGFTWITYPERLQSAGVSWKVYQGDGMWYGNALSWFAQFKNATPGTPLYDRGMVVTSDVLGDFRKDVTNGSLPQVSWVVSNFGDSEHPPYSPSSGAAFARQMLSILASNQQIFRSTVVILTYDENGGFFDHIPSPVPPPGTLDEFIGGWPIGLGVRVPMILISPWTRGGYVCSQVFDHSSLIRFLEVWTGVHEPNISAWRRQICGDLISAFDFSNPDYSIPNLPLVAPVNCSSNVVPTVPTPQTLPVQEPGTRPTRPLPYQPNANCMIDCGAGLMRVAMTNSGSASVHFAVYPNAYRSDGPWDFDVAPSNTITSTFNIITPGAGRYDFTCYGPNGFRRRFAGSLNTNCNQPDLTSLIDPAQGGITLLMGNPTKAPVTFTITNGYSAGGSSTYNVSAGSIVTNTFHVVANNGGWYDFTVTVDSDTNFFQQMSGHIETQPLRLRALLNSGNLLLMYPTWATGYSLESCSNLALSTWITVLGSSQTNSGDFTIVTLPATSSAAYFRLRK